jgi:hypothetical protein
VNDFQEGKVFPRPSPNAGPRDHEAAPGRAGQCTTSAVVRGGEVASAPRAERGRPRALQAQVVAGARTKRRGGAVGRRQKMTLREKEKLYIDCCASYNVEKARAPAGAARRGEPRSQARRVAGGQVSLITDEEFEDLKIDLEFEGSPVRPRCAAPRPRWDVQCSRGAAASAGRWSHFESFWRQDGCRRGARAAPQGTVGRGCAPRRGSSAAGRGRGRGDRREGGGGLRTRWRRLSAAGRTPRRS